MQVGPSVELSYVFVSLICPKYKDLVWGDNKVYFVVCFADSSPHVAFFISDFNTFLMLFCAWENAAFGIALPKIHIVV